MDMHLVVVKPFAGLARGDIVTDTIRINEILNSEHARRSCAWPYLRPGEPDQDANCSAGKYKHDGAGGPGPLCPIVPPQNLVLNGVPTNVVGVIGTASWGRRAARDRGHHG